MARPQNNISDEERLRAGQSKALGDTGDGDTGVARNQQGISNRQGDATLGATPADDEDDEDDEDETDDDELDEDIDGDPDDADDEVDDPSAEPGKPI